MRIKFGSFELDTNKLYSSGSEKECDNKIKIMKTKLHCTYLLIIATLICVWVFASTHVNAEFVNQVSFASTITSIILSVLAIIMSITGEGKTEHLKDQLEASAKEIKESQKIVNEINETIQESLNKVNEGMDILNKKMDAIPGATAEKVSEFTRSKEDMESRAETSKGLEI